MQLLTKYINKKRNNMSKNIKILCCVLLFQIITNLQICHAGYIGSTDWGSYAKDMNEVKCYETYGCFPIDGPWINMARQIDVHPQSPQEIKPRFAFYNTKLFDKSHFIDIQNPIELSNIKINQQTKIYVVSHGYLETGNMPWMLEMGTSLINQHIKNDTIVVLVDWGGGSHPPYVQAAANIRVVGVMTAHLIHLIYKHYNLRNLNNVHLIGHSLGAHLMGYAGHHLQSNFGLKVERITGLDPAAPLFSDTDNIVHLDTSDAKYVDVIHTDANSFMNGGLGMSQRIGHVDFYPNGGSNNPGCDMQLADYMRNTNNTILSNMQEFLGCNHIRSYQFFTESITSECPFMGITCDSYADMKDVKCFDCEIGGNICLPMGFHSYRHYKDLQLANRVNLNDPLKLFLMTGDQSPFCRQHYKITVRIAGHDESTLHGGEIGMLSFQLHGKKSRTKSKRINFSEQQMYFEPGFEYEALVPGETIQNPKFVTVNWEYQTSILNPLTWRIIASPRIFIEHILIESMENPELYLKLCSFDNLPVTSNSENVLQAHYCKDKY